MPIRMTISEARKHGLTPVRKRKKAIVPRGTVDKNDLAEMWREADVSCGVYRIMIHNWTPVLCNQWYGRGWQKRWRLGKEQAVLLRCESKKQDIPKAVGKRRVSIEVHDWPGNRKLPDSDSFSKLLLDGLVTAGLLIDDSAEGLDGSLAVKIVRDKSKYTIITLEDVPGHEKPRTRQMLPNLWTACARSQSSRRSPSVD